MFYIKRTNVVYYIRLYNSTNDLLNEKGMIIGLITYLTGIKPYLKLHIIYSISPYDIESTGEITKQSRDTFKSSFQFRNWIILIAVGFDVKYIPNSIKISQVQNAVKVFDEMPHTNLQNLTVHKHKHQARFHTKPKRYSIVWITSPCKPYLFRDICIDL